MHCTGYRAVVAIACCCAGFALAADVYPNRPIRWVQPFPPGGATDVIIRPIAPRLAEALGQPVVIDNRPGAGTNVGMEIVARASPDGYTLLFATTSIAINPSLYRRLGYAPLKDLAPVTFLTNTPNMLAVHPAVPVKTTREFIELAKSRPGQMSYGSSGNGATNHLSMELLKSQTGIDLNHVPYKGGGPAQVALIAGEVQALFNPASSLVPHVRSGRMRAIALASLRRSPMAPDMPTFDESGVKGFQAGVWYGLLVPAGTPRAVIERLNAETVRILRLPEVHDRLTALDYEVKAEGPDAFGAHIRAEAEKWARVVKASGARVD